MSQSYLTGVNEFLDDLASANATPGGGAAAAIVGGITAALTSMVANLTIGKKKYAEVEDQARSILERATALRGTLLAAYDEDVEAFDKVMAAFKLPKDSDADKAARQDPIQSATKDATLTPMRCAEAAIEGLNLALEIAKIGNTNAISDAGAGSLALVAAAYAATLNMRINLGSIADESFKNTHAAKVEELESTATKLGNEVRAIVLSKIA
ncbi:MAG: cyclodeaminase/cyclohydrolase family protein [Planctomycetes bacterium]|nr:cyclodeaminase/cyclohydrolase family protein [Planctomycetota bacterium]